MNIEKTATNSAEVLKIWNTKLGVLLYVCVLFSINIAELIIASEFWLLVLSETSQNDLKFFIPVLPLTL